MDCASRFADLGCSSGKDLLLTWPNAKAALLGAVELGGTKILAAVGRDPMTPLEQVRIATREPALALEEVTAFFLDAERRWGKLGALGVASFGPIDIRKGSPTWGHMGRTSKPGWKGTDVGPQLQRELGCPINLDTDVNGAALAEARWGAGRGLSSFAYVTVGTGIGGGIVINGRPVHGAIHPEIGHLRLIRDPRDKFVGRCDFHFDCAEALVSGAAIVDRFGKTFGELRKDHPFQNMLADYLGQLCATLVLVVSPQAIVVGGGVMATGEMHAPIDIAMRKWLGDYLEPSDPDKRFIVPPYLPHPGLTGGFALAQEALR